MGFFARIARFLFWLFVASWGIWLLRRLLNRVSQNAMAGSDAQADGAFASRRQVTTRRLVRDPVCGMHIDKTLSIPSREGNERLHFCSIACRDAYRAQVKKLAASG